ncbi:unnamed protein product [Gongylonema pulchrum]|uniref:Uncharacterized protein n=1 Tax=Gongylonema pulchrum TaxID=637853 RepID=A0A183EXL8_9BILA|nr:unnamed protein product [Gongylonema pulchrum]
MAVCFSGGQPGYHLTAPSVWCEIPLHQWRRKHHFENMHVEGLSRTWFHQSDPNHHSNIHVFEMLHFQHALRVSHVDICLSFHATCVACPDVEVRLYRRKDNVTMPSSSKSRTQPTLAGITATLLELETLVSSQKC